MSDKHLTRFLNELAGRLRVAVDARVEPDPEDLTLFWAISWKLSHIYSRKWCRGYHDLEPDEIATDTVIEISKRFPRCLQLRQATYTTFLYGATRNNYIDALRQVRRSRGLPLEEAPESPAPGLTSEEHLIEQARLKEVRAIIQTLSRPDRVIILEIMGLMPLRKAVRMLRVSRPTFFRRRAELVKRLRRSIA